MGSDRFIFCCTSIGICLICLALNGFSLAGFSFNSAAVKSAYWASAIFPSFEYTVEYPVENEFAIPGFNTMEYVGLRLIVQECRGSSCNGKGDDIAGSENILRIQNCYNAPNNDAQTDCLDCQKVGKACGALAILSLTALVASLCVAVIRLFPDYDTRALKISGVALPVVVAVLLITALSIYMTQCLRKNKDRYSHDDHIDGDEVEFSVGPGWIVLCVVTLLQPFLIILHAVLPSADSAPLANQAAGKEESRDVEM